MKHHFFISYCGNKRTEVKKIYEALTELGNVFNDTKIKQIIEPYCGSSAISYYIWTIHGDKFKYILNDGDVKLMELYKIFKSEEETRIFQNKINEHIKKIREEPDEIKRKIIYNRIDIKTSEGFYIKSKFHSIRVGLFPRNNKWNELDLSKCPIIDFLRCEYVKISTGDGLNLTKESDKDEKNLIILDPPYLFTTNSEYGSGSLTSFEIYEYLTKRPEESKAKIYAILENMWFIKWIYPNNERKTYEKKYTGGRKKMSEHVVIKF